VSLLVPVPFTQLPLQAIELKLAGLEVTEENPLQREFVLACP
jgi:hypothetical protein